MNVGLNEVKPEEGNITRILDVIDADNLTINLGILRHGHMTDEKNLISSTFPLFLLS